MSQSRTYASPRLPGEGIGYVHGPEHPARELRPRFFGLFLLQLLFVGCVSSRPGTPASRPEKTFRVSGYVLDSLTRKPVPGMLVQSTADGMRCFYSGTTCSCAQTDENGRFDVSVPALSRAEAGALVVRTIRYDGKATIPADSTQRVTLLLKRNAFRFQPYGCQQPADSVRIPPHYASIPGLGLPESKLAFLFQDSILDQPRRLRSLTFRFGPNGFAREPFQIRIYQNNGPSQPPGQDLFKEFFVVCPEVAGVFTYDLSEYNTLVSATGFFVAVEYVFGGDRFYCTNPVVGYHPTGPLLRPPCASADTRTWHYIAKQGWQRLTPTEHYWPLYESALSAEVEPAPR